ncbi:hypothetical protein HYFRA_00013136 [Hymenoscyphus fraxineus]|uniref:Uncharacterized protein n=1 Tax=Hymenoscyphus fraxineus TaxID=746836 RepID=A0A9N9L5H9_9HELO|nr:hypothetical protein HYFRA_00013136 [Hymenoscyphus fraxineus]
MPRSYDDRFGTLDKDNHVDWFMNMKEIIIREGDSFVTENTLDQYAGKVDSRGVMKIPIAHNENKKKVYEEANGRVISNLLRGDRLGQQDKDSFKEHCTAHRFWQHLKNQYGVIDCPRPSHYQSEIYKFEKRDEESIIHAWQRLKGYGVTLMSLDVQMGLSITDSFLFMILTKSLDKIPDYRTTLSDLGYTATKGDAEYKIQRLAEKEISLARKQTHEGGLLPRQGGRGSSRHNGSKAQSSRHKLGRGAESSGDLKDESCALCGTVEHYISDCKYLDFARERVDEYLEWSMDTVGDEKYEETPGLSKETLYEFMISHHILVLSVKYAD